MAQSTKLCSYKDLPLWQQDNHYILHGYVRETKSFAACFKSLLYLHNESGNIYTHLIPALVVALSIANGIIPVLATDLADQAILLLFFSGVIACLGISGFYHCIKCHSPRVSAIGNGFDYFGIVVLIEASMISLIYYGLKPHPFYRTVFCLITSFFGLICTVVSLDTKFRTPVWRPFRAKMFVAYGLSGILPIVFGSFLYGAEVVQRISLPYILLEGFLYISGAALYAARIPEKFGPGKYDYFGHSHQLFHILVVLAACSHGYGLYRSYQYSLTH